MKKHPLNKFTKAILALALLITAGLSSASAADGSTGSEKPTAGRRIYMTKGGDQGSYLNGSTYSYAPGDTLVLRASLNPWSYFSLGDFHGTASAPIVIINEGGQVQLQAGFNLENCTNVKIVGTGSSDRFGFLIEHPSNGGVAIDLHGKSAKVEVSNVHIRNKQYGFWIKNEAHCDPTVNNWIISDITIHDVTIQNVSQEGFYIGSTAPNNERPVFCNGQNIYPTPSRVGNIRLYNNVVDNTGRGGIQLSSANYGFNEIYNNTITNNGYEFDPAQGNGIVLGGYTHAYVHDNTINNTFASGIFSLGSGEIRIENNTINNSGSLYGRTANGNASIMMDTRPTTPVENTTFTIRNNKLGAQTHNNITVYGSTFGTGNIICNNTLITGGTPSIFVIQGVTWGTCLVNQPPVVNAGPDQTMTLPVVSVQLNGSATDPDGYIASYKWTKVSGPETFLLSSTSITAPTITGLTTGTYVFRLTVTDNSGGITTDDIVITINPSPISASSSNIKVEAENWSAMKGVGTEPTSDAGGGQSVGWIDNTDWMDYTVNIPKTGTYTFGFRVATMATNAQLQLRNAAGATLATVSIPNTTGWQSWQTITGTATLPAGQQTLRIVATSSDSWNFNYFEIQEGGTSTTPSNLPPTVNAGPDQSITLPVNSVQLGATANDADGSIASYSWTKVSGIEGGFSNTTVANPIFGGLFQGTYTLRLTVTDNSGATASDDVVVTVNGAPSASTSLGLRIQAESWTGMKGVGTEGTSDDGGGLSVGWIDNTDWMDYTVNLSQGGTYTVGFRVATPATSGQLKLLNAAGTTLATVNVPNTGWWQNWQTVTATVTLPAGQQVLRVLSSSADAWNFNWFELVAGGSGSAPANQLPTVNAGNDQTITLPTSSVQLSATATDADGTIASYSWTKVSGPAEGNFSSTSVANPTFSGLAQGTYTLKVTATDNSGATVSDEIVITVNAAPSSSNPSGLRVQAENWTGMKGVGTEGTSDDGGGLSVGWIDNTDWMDYSVNITQAGTYTVGFRVASPATSGQLKLLNAAGTTLATVNVPNTGWWQNWQTATATVTLPAGQQTLRVLSSSADAWNFNWFEIGSGSSAAPANQLPTVNAGSDQTITLPTSSVQLSATATDPDGTIASYSWTKVSGPAEGNFSSTSVANPTFSGLVQGTYTLKVTATDNSGATASDEIVITVNAAPVVSNASAIRVEAEKWTSMSGVGTEGTSDVGGGLSVGWIDNYDWMDYSVNMPSAGTYVVSFRVASPATSGQLQLRNTAGTVLATVAVPNTGWWQNWQSVSATVTLPAGQQTLRVVSTSADAWNFNYFELALAGAVATRSLGAAEVEGTTTPAVSVETLEIFPNPVSDRFVLKVSSPLTGTMKVQVLDVDGKVQKQYTLQKTAAGATQNYLSAQGLAKGEYTLKVQVGEWSGLTRLIKQ
jgi:parallel beta-helix repeat protein